MKFSENISAKKRAKTHKVTYTFFVGPFFTTPPFNVS